MNGDSAGQYKVIKRTAKTITIEDKHGETLRKTIKADNDCEFVGLRSGCVLLTAKNITIDESQPEKPQTCSNPDTTNITPADDTQEDTQNAQPENVKFVVGKTYLCGLSVWGLDWDGYKATHYSYKITITGRKGNYLTIHDELYGETAKRKLFANEKGVEYIRPKGSYGAYRKLVLFADYPTVEPEIPTTLPPDVANNESDNTAQPDTTDNTGFTVVPSEHIERPEYTVYPDTITDECPYTVIPACDIPAHNPAAAVVPYADARNIRNFFHILAIYIRMWLAINIHKLNIAIPMPGVFPPDYVIAKSTTAKKRPALIPQKQERKEAWQSHSCQYCENDPRPEWTHKQFALGIILSTEYSNYKTKTRYCTKSMSEWLRDKYTLVQLYKINKALGYQLLLSYNPSTKKAAFALSSAIADTVLDMEHYYVCTYEVLNPPALPVELQKYFTSRADCLSPIIIPAAVKDITPQPAPQKLDRLWLFADDMKDYNMIRRKNKSLIDACDSEEAITALMLTLDTTDILNQANYCRVHLCTGIPHSSDHKSDEQLASEFAAVIMKRRAKKLKASQPKTQQKPEKKEPAPASAPELNGKLIDTANLHGNDWRNAHRHNISVITSCLFREAVTALLLKVSVSTIREIGGQLGTLNKHVKGNKSQLIARFVDRLFEIRSIRNKKTVTTTTTPHNATSTQHKGFKIVQLKNRQLGFIFSE